MWLVLAILSFGIITGLSLQNKINEKIFDVLLKISIYALLFLLGLSIGTNKKLMDNLGKISLQALLITLGAIAGSLLAAKLLYYFWQKRNQK